MKQAMDMQLPHYRLHGCGAILPIEPERLDHRDPDWRGLVKLWEPPRQRARYIMGIDPAGGIVNWSRARRFQDDAKIDNSAIEVIRVGNGRNIPDVQVAEFAAPMMAEDIVEIAVLLGRLYCGTSEFEEALCIIETSPGPGMLTYRGMVDRYAYRNMWRWEYLNTAIPTIANSFGWNSNRETVRYLWDRFARHCGRNLLVYYSEALFAEMAGLQTDAKKTFPQPSGERVHDDRVRAMAMAVWAAHDWILEESPTPAKINDARRWINPQASDCSLEDMEDLWNEMFSEFMND